MRKLTKAIRETLRLAREKTITNAWELLKSAVKFFEQERYATSCFLAMTAIEETGKLFVLQLAQGDIVKTFGDPPSELNTNNLNKFLRDHLDKTFQAAADSLFINASADRRHGVHPISGVHRTSGVVLLARSGRWMEIRNACLYTDINFVSNSVSSPSEFITREHAYYFICMGFEVLVAQTDSGLGSSLEGVNESKSLQFREDRINDLKKFMERLASTVNIDKLDFLSNPEPLRKETRKRKIKEKR